MRLVVLYMPGLGMPICVTQSRTGCMVGATCKQQANYCSTAAAQIYSACCTACCSGFDSIFNSVHCNHRFWQIVLVTAALRMKVGSKGAGAPCAVWLHGGGARPVFASGKSRAASSFLLSCV